MTSMVGRRAVPSQATLGKKRQGTQVCLVTSGCHGAHEHASTGTQHTIDLYRITEFLLDFPYRAVEGRFPQMETPHPDR